MARAPPVSLFRSPDQSHLRRSEETNKTHQAASSNSSYNSTKSRNTEAMNNAISERELEGIQKIISPDQDKQIQRKLFIGNESPNRGLQHTQKSHDSIEPIARSGEANFGEIGANSPELRLQIRPTSQHFHGELTTGVCSPGEEVRPIPSSSKMAGQITGDMKSGKQTVEDDDGATGDDCSLDEEDQAGPNGQKQGHNTLGNQQMEMEGPQATTRVPQRQHDHLAMTSSTNLEVIDVENSSHFSFGVKPVDIIPSNEGHLEPGMNPKLNKVLSHGSLQEQQQANIAPLSNKPNVESTQAAELANPASQSVHRAQYFNENQKTKQIPSVEPAPYTVVQTLAARLRQIHATQTIPIELVPPKHTTKQGQPAVIYDMDDFMNKLAVDCKYTLIGKFSTTMPKIELIRKSFILQTQLNGGVNIAHYNARHVFIDLENELDYNTVWTQQRMTIEGKLMRIQAWTPNFKPEEETPIVPIWVLLPGLPWHCFKKEFITPLLESVGKVLYLDTASINRTRASMAKVKVQVDLTKTRPRHVWIGLDEEDLTIGRWQPIEYENIPPYCAYCRHQGHMIGDCNFKIRDEDLKRRKELGAEMKNMSMSDQGQQGNENRQVRPREQEEQQHRNTKEGNTPEQQKEEEWQVSRRKSNKPMEEKTQKAVWRPTSPKNKMPRDQPQPTAQQKVEGGMEGGCQESHTNLQEKGSKGGNLPHVMHEGIHLDHSPDLRAPATTTVQLHKQTQQQVQQQVQSGPGKLMSTENNKETQQVRAGSADKQNIGAMAKDMGAKASTSNQGNAPKSKNKPSKKKREAEKKKRQSIQKDNVQQGKQQKEGEVCKKFIMVEEHLGMDITPLQTQYMSSPIKVPPDDRYAKCHLNTGPIIDEYAVNNSEDEPDVDNQSLKDPDEDDETSELLIRAFSPHPDKDFAEEIQQATNSQGLSPRGFHHERFKFHVQDINTVTAGRPNTRLFTSPASQ
ncbi:hypothetical protein KY290_012823 [Solanum tuberosum]|uniref:DUF4283 domain-containing protein n=1 Tax=Solanum tuberosum TaxID=4113 RepID=A0ABQ7VMZ5_SOLTU|nr:hypothetical protein KY290_012823 [Solanum tuberosum]